MDLHQLKIKAAHEALKFIQDGEILGVGTGSTVNCFIELLPTVKHKIKACVSSSERSTQLLHDLGFTVLDLNAVERFSVYIDGADESNANLELIKGGGAALTREKIVCAHAETFVCIVDQTKKVDVLGAFPLPIEVIPMAAQYIIRQMAKIGGHGTVRKNCITDNGNVIVDVTGLRIEDPIGLECYLNGLAGVVTNGLFAIRPADHLIVASQEGIQVIDRQ